MKVLIVDDDLTLANAMIINLRARGIEPVAARTGSQALAIASKASPAVVVLDLGLPDIDGIDVLAELRRWSHVPVVVLSARDSPSEKVRALNAGADDYLAKPFDVEELVARIRAAHRRATARPRSDESLHYRNATLEIDRVRAIVTCDGNEVHLTPTEWHILDLLAAVPGRLVSQRDLLQQIWGSGYERNINYLRVHVAALRRKLEPNPATPKYILTEPGHGYRLVAQNGV